jgi:hypothetical protein
MLKTISKPPKHLAPATKRWWKWVIPRWRLERYHFMVLSAAAEAWDRMKQGSEAQTEWPHLHGKETQAAYRSAGGCA